jgi:hypothetical protein
LARLGSSAIQFSPNWSHRAGLYVVISADFRVMLFSRKEKKINGGKVGILPGQSINFDHLRDKGCGSTPNH